MRPFTTSLDGESSCFFATQADRKTHFENFDNLDEEKIFVNISNFLFANLIRDGIVFKIRI